MPSTGQARSDSPGPQALEVAGGIAQAVGVVHAHPVHHAVANELEHLGVREGEDLGILLAHPGQLVDVEEAPVPARLRVHVEDPRTALGIGPRGVLLGRGHVVGHDVEHHAQSRPGEGAQRLLPPQLLGDPRRVHHVVAVRGARPGLERRREIEVGHPEVAQIGDQAAGLLEPELARELQPVCRPQLSHGPGALGARCSRVSARGSSAPSP